VLRRIFGPKRDEVTEEWRRLHNEELYALHTSLNIFWLYKSIRLRWAGSVARMGKRVGAYMVGKPEGRIPLGVSRVNLTQQAVILTLGNIFKTLNTTSGLQFAFCISNVSFMLSAYCER
jgi:hypothetical protein